MSSPIKNNNINHQYGPAHSEAPTSPQSSKSTKVFYDTQQRSPQTAAKKTLKDRKIMNSNSGTQGPNIALETAKRNTERLAAKVKIFTKDARKRESNKKKEIAAPSKTSKKEIAAPSKTRKKEIAAPSKTSKKEIAAPSKTRKKEIVKGAIDIIKSSIQEKKWIKKNIQRELVPIFKDINSSEIDDIKSDINKKLIELDIDNPEQISEIKSMITNMLSLSQKKTLFKKNFESDLTQNFGEKSIETAIKIDEYLGQGIDNSKDVMQSLTNSKDKINGLIKSFGSLSENLDLTKEENCKFLNEIVGLIHKGFSATGGIGRFQEDGWDSKFTTIKFDTQNAEEQKETFKKMLKYFEDNIEKRFSNGNVETSMTSNQIQATIGQLIQDFILGNFSLENRNALKEELLRNFVLDKSAFSGVEEFRNKLRGNPLLLEVQNEKFSDVISDTILPSLNLSEDKKEVLKNGIKDYCSQKSGIRGRTDLKTKNLPKAIKGDLESRPNYYSQVTHETASIEDKDFVHAHSGFRPITMPASVRIGSATSNLNSKNITKHIKKQIEKHFPNEAENQIAILNNKENQIQEELNKKIKEEHLDNDNVAHIMHENNLPTICSISGTTTDIALALFSQLGQDRLSSLLKPMSDYAQALNSNADLKLEGEQAEQFKHMFAEIAMFMQSGQYHSSAEALGGLLIASLAIEDIKMTEQETVATFTKLMKNFSQKPEDFFPLDYQNIDQTILENKIKEAKQNQVSNAKTRLNTQEKI